MKGSAIECIFTGDRLNAIEAANSLMDLFVAHYGSQVDIQHYDEKLRLYELPDRIRSAQRRSFLLEVNSLEVRFAFLPNYDHACVIIEDTEDFTTDWLAYVNCFRSRTDLFSICTYDRRYECWQNMTDPRVLTNMGLPTDDLTIFHDEMFDIDQVDTTGNPGRRVLQHGYVEAIGAEMWLGAGYQHFFPGVEQRLPDDWIAARNDTTLHIVSYPTFFTQPHGEQREVQDTLRAVLFPPS